MKKEEKYRSEMMDENYGRDVAGCFRIIVFFVVAIIVGAVLLLT
jgi:hypothetical protein